MRHSISLGSLIAVALFVALPAAAQQTDVSGAWGGTLSWTLHWVDTPCANGTPADFNAGGAIALLLTQSGTNISGTIGIPHDVSDHKDGSGNCQWIDNGPQVGPVSGTISGNMLTLSIAGSTASGTVNGATMTFSFNSSLGPATATLTKAGVPAPSSLCTLGTSLTCDSGDNCSATVINNGSNSCAGDYLVVIGVTNDQPDSTNSARVTNFQESLSLAGKDCFNQDSLPLGFGYAGCFGSASLDPGNSFNMSGAVLLNNTPATEIVALTEVVDPNGGATLGLTYAFNGVPGPPITCTPVASVPASVQSGSQYTVSWTPVLDSSATFTIDESTAPDFSASLVSTPASGNSMQFSHSVTAATTYYYRVRASSCNGLPGANSPTVAIVVEPVPTVSGKSADVTAPFGSTAPVAIKVFVPSPSGKQAEDAAFTASTDKPYLTVAPSSGTIPSGGTTLTVTANPTGLPPGASSGTLKVTANGTTTSTTVSVSLTTPVGPGVKTLPPPNSLIIPVIAHAPGALGPFVSDVRLVNANTSAVNYQLTYTPTNTDGTTTGKTTTLPVDPGQSIALNDILKDFFGIGLTGDSGFGALELRPLNSSTTLNYASSRTYTFNPNGTYGQFITAIPFSNFATKAELVPLPGVPAPPTPVLSLQQISDAGTGASTGFRTQIGLVEGSGTPASGHITLFDDSHNQVATTAYTLLSGEHVQKSLAAWFGLQTLPISDGRIEVTSEAATGAVTAYASVLDNITNAPVAIPPVQPSQVSAMQFILPGMAALQGTNNFHSDVRLYNAGTSAVTLNATYYPQNNGTPVHGNAPFTIAPGQVTQFNDIIAGPLFNAPGNGGSVVFTSATPASVVATGRTYTIAANNGTYGQFIPGVTPSQGIGLGDRPMQILQLEESPSYRSNIGFVELTGNPVTVRVTATIPDSKTAASVDIPLGPYQFYQPRLLAQLYPGQAIYNARISLQVIGGTGRAAAYGSVIDNGTNAGAYVPSQP